MPVTIPWAVACEARASKAATEAGLLKDIVVDVGQGISTVVVLE